MAEVNSDQLITIGEIIRHQGNKGEVKVKALTNMPDRFEDLDEVYLVAGRDKKTVEIEQLRYHKGFVILKFVGFDGIEAAIEHKGYKIKIAKEDTVELDEDSYFLYQVVGLQVYTVDGEYLGEVEEILETGANDVYKVKQDGSKILIPALKEVVIELDIEGGKLVVELPAGLR
jgi:16S rRNA processing protein RimM